jgi:hypothetical protein
MLVSSIPNAFVASQVKSAESVRSVCLMLRSDRTPFGSISSRIVYLHRNIIKKNLQQQKEHHNNTHLTKPEPQRGTATTP